MCICICICIFICICISICICICICIVNSIKHCHLFQDSKPSVLTLCRIHLTPERGQQNLLYASATQGSGPFKVKRWEGQSLLVSNLRLHKVLQGRGRPSVVWSCRPSIATSKWLACCAEKLLSRCVVRAFGEEGLPL